MGDTLFIIYAEPMTKQYHGNLSNELKNKIRPIKIKNQTTEYAWAPYLYKVNNKKNHGEVLNRPTKTTMNTKNTYVAT